jgi:uncharacterized protein (TIGR02611 family)
MKPGARNRFVEGLQERRARHKERHHLIRVAAAIGGFLVVLLGIVLIPLPGPGLLVVAVGLAVLALEFAWAEHLLEKTVDRLSEARERVKRASPVGQAAVALIGVLAAAASLIVAYTWDIPLLPV